MSDLYQAPLRQQLDGLLDSHRAGLAACLDGLSEDDARRRLVPSRTTLLGLVKHATFVERVWFAEAISHVSRPELGIPTTPDDSFVLDEADTIGSVLEGHRLACAASREAVAGIELDTIVSGNRRGPLPLRWIYLHMIEELAQHQGHAEILRELVRGGRARSRRADS